MSYRGPPPCSTPSHPQGILPFPWDPRPPLREHCLSLRPQARPPKQPQCCLPSVIEGGHFRSLPPSLRVPPPSP